MSTIITRNSATSGSTPASLVQGELAINVKDGRLFYGSGSGNVVKEFTGSASGGTIDTGSFVTTSSFNNYTGSNTSQFAGTASYATNALTASYAISASYEINYETSSSYADFAVSASHALNADNAISSSYALTASYVQNAQTASYVLNAVSTSYATTALSASFASTASYVVTAQTASFVTASNVYGPFGSNSVLTASYALNGGVTQLLAGPNVTLSPTNGLGQVTVSATLSGSTNFNTATGSYGSFYSTQTQTNVAGTARSMSLNTTDITNGVSISGSTNPFNTYIKVANAGVYDIQFSAQLDKSDAGKDEIWIWLRKNGTDLTDTATSVQLTGNADHQVAAWNFFANAAANDYFQLMWYSSDANVRLHAEPAFGVVPGIPSLIVTANRVDQFLSNTGSFSGSFTGNLIGTASYATQALSASYAPGGGNPFPFNGDAQISGSLGVTGSFSVLNSIDATNKILVGSGPIPGSTEDSVNWDSRTLFDSNGNFSVKWGNLRSLYDTNVLQSIDWQNRQLKDSNGNENLNWSSGVSITGSLTVSGSLRGQVSALSISSNTASINMSTNNFFTLALVNGANTHINPTNINPGQTVNIRVTQGSLGTGTVSFPSFVDQPSGSLYTGSAVANAIDIVTMITFDSSIVFVSSVRNMI